MDTFPFSNYRPCCDGGGITLPTGELVDIEFSDDEVYQSALASLRDINAEKAGAAVGVLTAVLTMGAATAYIIPVKNSFTVWTAVMMGLRGSQMTVSLLL